jgi:hypothetical protein
MFRRLFTKLKVLFRGREVADDPWLHSQFGRILLETRRNAEELVKRYTHA